MTDLSEIKAAFSENAETVNKSITALRAETAELLARIEDMETSSTRPGLTIEKGETRETREHKKLFESWLRKPRDSHTKQALGDFQHNMAKAMNITTGSDGGFAAPAEWVREVERLEKKFSPVRNLVRVISVGSNDVKLTVSIRGADFRLGW